MPHQVNIYHRSLCDVSFISASNTLGGIPLADISVSSLDDSSSSPTTTTTIKTSNISMEKLAEILDQQATSRESLIKIIDDLQITTSNSLKLQSTTLVQLTSSTNELTRKSLVRFKFFFHYTL